MTPQTVARDLRETVESAAPRLAALSEGEASRPRAPGKWSPKEVIGHLIDSVSHNHQRFVRARFVDHLEFEGYEQDRWVAEQRYASVPWGELVGLWRLYNLHLARVIEGTPAGAGEAPRTRHNLDRIAWKPVPRDRPATLLYFMDDYVGHLRHHLGQVLG
jgi:hypothetical protein